MGVEQDCVSADPKLFVGQIAPDVSREQLHSLFAKYGNVLRIDMIGSASAMVWFGSWTDAERALEGADAGEIDLDGKKRMVVRIADPPRRGSNGIGIKPMKLFVGQVPRDVSEVDVRTLFERFGSVVEFEMPQLRHAGPGRATPQSNNGCAFIRYKKWSEAEAAIKELHERHQFPDSRRPLVVKFADAKPPQCDPKNRAFGMVGGKRPLSPDMCEKMCKRMGLMEPGPMGPMAMNGAMLGGYGMGGDPLSLGFMSSRMGCAMGMGSMTGMGRMFAPEQANNVLTGKVMNGANSMDLDGSPALGQQTSMGKRDKTGYSMSSFQNGNANRMGYIGGKANMGMAMGMGMGMGMGLMNAGEMPIMDSMVMNGGGAGPMMNAEKLSLGNGGAGRYFPGGAPPIGPNNRLGRGISDPRAKEHTLFVGQIPHEADEYDLWAVFCEIGEILELNILRKDGKSRGAAFVTFDTKEMASGAIERINGVAIPWDPTGRKLVVRFREKRSKTEGC